MKTLVINLMAVLGLLALSVGAYATDGTSCVATGTGTITASMIVGLSVINIDNATLVFGSAVPCDGGTITVGTDGSKSSVGTVQPMNATPGSAAKFQVAGSPSFACNITLPSTATITSGSNSMVVDHFVSNPSGQGLLDGTGKQNISVGGTLHVGAAQAIGNYTGTFTITVSYN